MTLRVALVALYPAPGAKAPGGVRAVVQNLVRGLQTYDDLHIHVIHCHADIQASATVEDRNVKVDYIAMPRRRLVPNTLRSIVRVERLLRQVQPDVVNTHAAHYTVAALRAGYPTVFTIHGVVHREAQVYKGTLFDRSRFLLESWCERYAIRHVRDVIAISPYVLQEYRSRSDARFHCIDNPLPFEFFAIPNLEEEGRLLYAGTIDERKNVIDLLRALVIVRQEMPHVRLRVAGRATSQVYYRKVQDFVATQGLESNVECLGLQDSAHLMQEYAHCMAVVLASRQETAPMAVIESMAAGKPVVATRVGGVPDLVEDGRSGFIVEPGDVAGFARCIVELLTDKDLRRRMGQRSRQLAERFRLETVAGKYRQLYYKVAGRAMP
jgi:glycosyltransferase involved in cell wall biosynthesis